MSFKISLLVHTNFAKPLMQINDKIQKLKKLKSKLKGLSFFIFFF